MFQDIYALLRIEPDADDATIKHAYRSMARRYHPDQQHGMDPAEAMEMMSQVNEAVRVLHDPKLRQLYDEYRDEMLWRMRLMREGRELPGIGMNPEESSLSRIDQELKAFGRIRDKIRQNRLRYGQSGFQASAPSGDETGRPDTGFTVGSDGGVKRSAHREGYNVHSRPEKVYIKTPQDAGGGYASPVQQQRPTLKRKDKSIWDKLQQTGAGASMGSFKSTVGESSSAGTGQGTSRTRPSGEPKRWSGLDKFPELPKPTGPEPKGDAERVFQKAVFDGLMKLLDASLNSVLWALHKNPEHSGALYFLGRYARMGVRGLDQNRAGDYLSAAEAQESGLAEKYASVFENL